MINNNSSIHDIRNSSQEILTVLLLANVYGSSQTSNAIILGNLSITKLVFLTSTSLFSLSMALHVGLTELALVWKHQENNIHCKIEDSINKLTALRPYHFISRQYNK
ncbi:hypothetical protein CLAVI_000420 [Candidatus Clavichlamydia salmonicola]|uniref:hypothetical protein n=1 Tax=Candidatus Clavichlamydia salmonicola TaxID=469812 RepID=UPI00189154CF|nr:hypothetical protein [Candidatus Clavichlamydia salmonicola]MBF5050801.1 hypothetical protein [Candidatus Clavichlamydia salmonicola]